MSLYHWPVQILQTTKDSSHLSATLFGLSGVWVPGPGWPDIPYRTETSVCTGLVISRGEAETSEVIFTPAGLLAVQGAWQQGGASIVWSPLGLFFFLFCSWPHFRLPVARKGS